MFFTLAVRLPAYSGVLAARLAAEERGGRPRARRDGGSGSYEKGSRAFNRASTAAAAPPVTAGQVAALNMQLGGQFFSYRQVPAAEAAGG